MTFEEWWKGDLKDWRGCNSVPALHARAGWDAAIANSSPEQPDDAYIKALEAERDQLRAEVEALRADAERYRWLRDVNRETELLVYSKGCELDESIDAARKTAE